MNYEEIYNQYLADQQDGFVSNLDAYIESMYFEENADGIKEYIIERINESCSHNYNI